MSEPKIALVTGANKGIGYEIALGLGLTGTTVLIGARDAARGATAAGKLDAEGITAVPVELNVTDPVSLSAAAARIDREYGRLDILVNNAGILLERGQSPSRTPVTLLERTFATNVYAVVAVTNALLPLIRRSAAGRIVNMSSGLGSLGVTSDPQGPYAQFPLLAYNSSKSALNSVTVSYANELRDTPIKVNSADPGYCATDMNGHAGPRTAEQGAIAAVRLCTLTFVFVFGTSDVGRALTAETAIPTWVVLLVAVIAIAVGFLIFIVTRRASAVKGRSSAASGNLALRRERSRVLVKDRVIRSTRFGSWPSGERFEQRSSFRDELNKSIIDEGADVRRIWNIGSVSDVHRLREMVDNYQGRQKHSIRVYFGLPYHALPELLIVEGRGASVSCPSPRNPFGLDWMIRFNRRELVTVVRDYFDVLWDRAERILDAGQPVERYEFRLREMEARLNEAGLGAPRVRELPPSPDGEEPG